MIAESPNLSLEMIFRKYGDLVYRTCYRYFRNPSDAEDISQEVFLKLHKRLPEFRGDSSLSTWIYRIASNSCIDALRQKKNHSSLDDLKFDDQVERNLSPGADAVLARIDLNRILDQTDSRTREILFLALAEGCSHEETGEIVGLTKWAVTKIVIRFQKKIRVQKKAWLSELFYIKIQKHATHAEGVAYKNEIVTQEVT